MVSTINSTEIILQTFPEFKKIWEKEIIESWGGESNDSVIMIEFSRYIKNMIAKNDIADQSCIKLAFELAEKLMNEGASAVQDAVATCFLENLINAVAWGDIPPTSFIHLLGEESKKYCKAWDEFTGVKTEGL